MKHKEGFTKKLVAVSTHILKNPAGVITKKKRTLPGINLGKKYWHMLGPGLTTGAADDDPSGIITYSQTGAKFGFQFLWLASFTFPLMAIVQEMCARIGLATGRGLAGNIRQNFPKPILYLCTILLFIANTVNIGADLQAMAAAIQVIFPKISSALLLVGITFLSLWLQIFTTYAKYTKYLKWLALTLFAYVFSALLSNLDWKAVATHALLPSTNFSKEQILLVCAVLGTTISPYLFFWQTSQEMEEKILRGEKNINLRKGATDKEIKDMRVDIWSGMFLSNIVMFFIIATCASVLFTHGITNIQTLEQAAEALRPLAGEASYLLFMMGIVGTGFLALPVLAGSSAYALAESFAWHNIGLYLKFKTAHGFYGVIIISMLVGLVMNFLEINPIKGLILAAVLNALIAPAVLVLIVLLSSNVNVMGKRVNSYFSTWMGWIVVGIMCISDVAAIISFQY